MSSNIADGVPLWSWCEVADWLRRNDMIAQDAAAEARELALVNAVLELQHLRRLAPDVGEEVLRRLSAESSPTIASRP